MDDETSKFESSHVGPCIACLYEDELNNEGLCKTCSPTDPEFFRVLVNLLKDEPPLDTTRRLVGVTNAIDTWPEPTA